MTPGGLCKYLILFINLKTGKGSGKHLMEVLLPWREGFLYHDPPQGTQQLLLGKCGLTHGSAGITESTLRIIIPDVISVFRVSGFSCQFPDLGIRDLHLLELTVY
jgi:hypothetical protein